MSDETERLIDVLEHRADSLGSCYECPYASPPLRRDGSVADWDEVWNDPTEAYFRCNMPGRSSDVVWGEDAPCTSRDIVNALLAHIRAIERERDLVLAANRGLRLFDAESLETANARIAALEAEVERYEDSTRCPVCDTWRIRAYAAEAEVERLRSLRDDVCAALTGPGGLRFEDMAERARSLRADAERYAWLRDEWLIAGRVEFPQIPEVDPLLPGHVDDAIDAAMKP